MQITKYGRKRTVHVRSCVQRTLAGALRGDVAGYEHQRVRAGGLVDAADAHLGHRTAAVQDGGVSRQNEEIAPAQRVAVLHLDRVHERARIVEVHVVGPRRLGWEALSAAGAVGAPEGARAVQRHADEEAGVRLPDGGSREGVGRPASLALEHERDEVAHWGRRRRGPRTPRR